jgi:signal transduction histidine kinase
VITRGNDRTLKLRILHKGLLLIFVPLVVQLLFFAQLFKLINEVEAIELEQAHRSEMVAIADQLIMEFGTSWTNLIAKLFADPHKKLDPEVYKTRMEELFKRVRPLIKEAPEMSAIMLEVEKAHQEQYEFYKDMMAANQNEDVDSQLPFLSYVKLRPKFAKIAAHGAALKQNVENEIAVLTDRYKQNEKRRVNLKAQIFIGVAADFTVTVLLLVAFLLDITKRLKTLLANAYLLPTGEALHDRVTGSDELAMLDVVLHEASQELQSAKEYRKSLMEMVAHDLRSPLSAARSTVDVLLDQSEIRSSEQSSTQLARLRRSLIQLIAFVEDLLTIDRLESGKLELELSLFKIDSLIDEAFDSLAIKAQGRHIKLVKEGENFEVVADQTRLAQVIMNLLTNAVKHSPDGGTVKVLTRKLERAVKLSVIDQGNGIPDAEQPRLFQKFVQGNDFKKKEGFGLGLAICKLIIDAHQGFIGLKSAVGKGSEFWFTLPNVEDGP